VDVCVTAINSVAGSVSIFTEFGLGPGGSYGFSSISPGRYEVSFAGCGANVAPQFWNDQSSYKDRWASGSSDSVRAGRQVGEQVTAERPGRDEPARHGALPALWCHRHGPHAGTGRRPASPRDDDTGEAADSRLDGRRSERTRRRRRTRLACCRNRRRHQGAGEERQPAKTTHREPPRRSVRHRSPPL
jgi:hypothetical protein